LRDRVGEREGAATAEVGAGIDGVAEAVAVGVGDAGIDGAGGGGAGAALRHVARTGRGTADRGARHERVRRAGVVHAVTRLGDVAETGSRTTDRRALRI